MTTAEKEIIKQDIVQCLAEEKEIRRIVVFGSFLNSVDPRDLDLAVFQDSDKGYLELSMRYRNRLRRVMERISVDVIPVRPSPEPTTFLREIEAGEVIYKK